MLDIRITHTYVYPSWYFPCIKVLDVQLVAIKIDFKAQKVIGANYRKFSPVFNGG